MAAKDIAGEIELAYPPFRPTALTEEVMNRFGTDDLEDYPFLYPMLQDERVNEDGSDAPEDAEEIEHPVIAAIIANGNKWDSVDIVGRFRDDHCDCYNVEMVVDGKKYGYSDWWLSSEGSKMYMKCDGKWEDAKPKFREMLLSHLTSYRITPEQQG